MSTREDLICLVTLPPSSPPDYLPLQPGVTLTPLQQYYQLDPGSRRLAALSCRVEAVKRPVGATEGLEYTRTKLVMKDEAGAKIDLFLYSIFSENCSRLGVRRGDILIIAGRNFIL